MARKLTSKGLETFSSCLLYTCETAYHSMVAAVKREHHLPGQRNLSAHRAAQNRRPSLSDDKKLGRRIFPPVNLEQSNLRLFKFLASLGLQTSNLGQCGTSSSVVPKELPCTVFLQQPCITFHTNRYVALVPCECKLKGNNCIKRIL